MAQRSKRRCRRLQLASSSSSRRAVPPHHPAQPWPRLVRVQLPLGLDRLARLQGQRVRAASAGAQRSSSPSRRSCRCSRRRRRGTPAAAARPRPQPRGELQQPLRRQTSLQRMCRQAVAGAGEPESVHGSCYAFMSLGVGRASICIMAARCSAALRTRGQEVASMVRAPHWRPAGCQPARPPGRPAPSCCTAQGAGSLSGLSAGAVPGPSALPAATLCCAPPAPVPPGWPPLPHYCPAPPLAAAGHPPAGDREPAGAAARAEHGIARGLHRGVAAVAGGERAARACSGPGAFWQGGVGGTPTLPSTLPGGRATCAPARLGRCGPGWVDGLMPGRWETRDEDPIENPTTLMKIISKPCCRWRLHTAWRRRRPAGWWGGRRCSGWRTRLTTWLVVPQYSSAT